MDLLKYYFPLCFFSENPLKLPRSDAFFKANLVIYYFVELFMQVNMIPPWEAFIEVNLETVFTLGFIAMMMSLNRNYQAFTQVATAFLVCENVIAIFAVPTLMWLTVTDDFLSYVVFGVLIFWDMCLVTYLIKQVLSINVFASLAVSFIYFMMTYGAAYSLMLVF
ncbi:MAG: hypothetical protein KAH08_03695 [Methylococcales bacterium]|nr:hypothetical protein [Methylococcales bacterium]